jgi:predicted regulator of Ras-like GTPase activity (Roadblock/LC7/MglB family)/lipopolysaccharide biosynthesis regulator YciM
MTFDKAEIDDRIDKCAKILEVDPNSQIFAALAEAYRKRGDLERAFRICQTGLRIHPSYGSAHVVMAKINLDRGLYDWAEAEIKKAIQIEGNSRAIELLLAEIYIYKGEFNSAVKLLRKLHQADPGNGQIKKLLDIALKLPEEQAMIMESQGGMKRVLREAQTPPPAQAPVAAPDPVISTGTVYTSGALVQKAVSLPDMEGALFVNFEGLVVDQEWGAEVDATTCGATMAEVQKALNQELVKVSFGQVNSLLIETAGPVFYLVRVVNGMFLFVANSKINLGTLRMRVGSLIERYNAK